MPSPEIPNEGQDFKARDLTAELTQSDQKPKLIDRIKGMFREHPQHEMRKSLDSAGVPAVAGKQESYKGVLGTSEEQAKVEQHTDEQDAVADSAGRLFPSEMKSALDSAGVPAVAKGAEVDTAVKDAKKAIANAGNEREAA